MHRKLKLATKIKTKKLGCKRQGQTEGKHHIG